jgi:uncharacterized protein (DUF305 family)
MMCRQRGNRFPVSKTYRRFAACLGAVLALGAAAACSAGSTPPPTNSAPVIVPGKPGEEASTIPPGQATVADSPAPNDADITFVKNMIVHHQQAVWMAELAPARASSRDVKELASRIADVQGPEIDAMNRWLSQHSVPTVNPTAPEHGHGGGAASMPGMLTEAQFEELEKAKGKDFDRLFLQRMITHHQGALTMADEVRKSGVDVRVQEIADDVTAEQTDEIRRMRAWLGN